MPAVIANFPQPLAVAAKLRTIFNGLSGPIRGVLIVERIVRIVRLGGIDIHYERGTVLWSGWSDLPLHPGS